MRGRGVQGFEAQIISRKWWTFGKMKLGLVLGEDTPSRCLCCDGIGCRARDNIFSMTRKRLIPETPREMTGNKGRPSKNPAESNQKDWLQPNLLLLIIHFG